jgi:hypothetical protein
VKQSLLTQTRANIIEVLLRLRATWASAEDESVSEWRVNNQYYERGDFIALRDLKAPSEDSSNHHQRLRFLKSWRENVFRR